jgi:hypothetical protein
VIAVSVVKQNWRPISLVAVVLLVGIILAVISAVRAAEPTKVVEHGALLFGAVVGWVTYRTLRRDGKHAHISDLAAILGAVGGTTVTSLFDYFSNKADALGWYMIGLFIGFFFFYLLHILLAEEAANEFLIGENEGAQKDNTSIKNN